ncbi:hypothetical protein QUA35_19770 [Microcoleus sp. N9_B2]|uniref:hypothetical protein n=1 Tax=unclassified Microcoleus TaxID=2642155 RepID=UPI002FD32382
MPILNYVARIASEMSPRIPCCEKAVILWAIAALQLQTLQAIPYRIAALARVFWVFFP